MKRRSCVHFVKGVGCGIECKDGCPHYTRVRRSKVNKDKYLYKKDKSAYDKEMTRIKRLGY